MDTSIAQPALTCPTCQEEFFTSETRGKIFKTTIYCCQKCGTVLEAERNEMFKVIEVGDDYNHATTLLIGKRFKRDNLGSTGLSIVSDSTLANISSGDDPALDELYEHAHRQTDRPPIILKANELVLVTIPNVEYCEERSKMTIGSKRVGFRVMKGVYISQSLSTPQYQQVITTLDTGTLIFTNLRYIFQGSTKNVDQPLTKLTNITAYLDAISISRSNKQKTEFYKGNLHWPLFAAILQGIAARANK